MTLGDIFKEVAKKDLAGNKVNGLCYTELVVGDKLKIKLTSSVHKDAFVECELPYTGKPEEENYLRAYFLSMVFNTAIAGMKRMSHKKKK